MLSKTRLSYALKDILVKKGVKNLLEFADVMSNEGIRLMNNGSLSPINLRDSLKGKDNGFFNSNSISRAAFYKIVVGVIKQESDSQKENSAEAEKNTSAVNFHNPQFHFGDGDNIGRDKKTTAPKSKRESFIEKIFWRFFVPLMVGVAIAIIVYRLGFAR